MAGILGGGSSSTNAAASPKYTQMNVQSSAYGLAIPLVYGTTRISVNLLWYANFQATTVNNPSEGGGGKGGVVGGGGKGCLAGEMVISGPDGNHRIDQSFVGQRVWSKDPDTGLIVIGTVVDVLKHSVAETGDRMMRVFLRDRHHSLHLTDNHFPWVDGKHRREIKDWDRGEKLITQEDGPAEIVNIIRAADVEFTWNLVVEPHHNFFAEGILLHNGGSGGGSKSGSTTYSADVICGACEGPIAGIPNSWASQTLQVGTPGFSVFDGALGQASWSYLEGSYPTQNINYSGTAYAGAASLSLGNSANLPAINEEVQAIFEATAPSTYGGNSCVVGGDADPSLIIPDMLTNGQYGLGFPANRIGQVTSNNEAHAVPVSGPYTVTVNNAAEYLYPVNVVDTIVDGVGTNLYTAVSGTPGPYQYNFNPETGVYTFNAAQAGVTVNIRYASLGALATYQDWCLAAGLWISPAYTQQAAASSLLNDIATATFSEFVWTSGVLTVVPRATASVSGNGYTFTAASEPLFELGIDDFMPNTNPTGTVSAAANDDPVIVTVLRASDQYNDIKIEVLDRENQYAPTVVEVVDQSLIDRFGRRASASQSLHLFCDVGAANTSAQLQLQDQNIRHNYSVQLDQRYSVLDPMDLVTLTDPDYPGLSGVPVRVLSVTENDDGTLSFLLEDYLGSVGAAAEYNLNTGSGYSPNFEEAPGAVNPPIIFAAPPALADNQGLEIWVGVSGSEPALYGGCQVWGASTESGPYKLLGTLEGASRMGVTTANFPVGADPDTTDTLSIDLSESNGTLEAGTDSDADQGNTLCLVRGANGDEYVAYSVATLTGGNQYALSGYLRRGQQDSAIVDHPSASPFLRLDQLIFKIPYQAAQISTTLWLKFLSGNIFGGGREDISSVEAYSILLPEPPAPPDITGFAGQQQGAVIAFTWDQIDYPLVALAGVYIGYAPQDTTDRNQFTLLTETGAGTEMANASVPPGTWTFAAWAANIANTPGGTTGLSPDITTFDLVVTNPNPVIYSADEAPAWAGTLSNLVRHYTGVLTPMGSKTVDQYNAIAAPSAPTLAQVAGGTMILRTLYAKVTYLSNSGETLASSESSLSVLLNNLLVVDDPSGGSPPTGATAWNVYVATSSGAETLQNTVPLPFGTNWAEPATGLIAGASPPTVNTTGWDVFDIFVPDVVASCSYKTAAIDTGYNDTLRVFFTENFGFGFDQSGTPAIQFGLDTWLTGESDPDTFEVPWTIGYETLRYVRGELLYAPVEGSVGYFSDFVPTIDTAPVTEQSAGNVTVAPGGTPITFPTRFHNPPLVTPVANSAGATSASSVSPSDSGFDFHIWTGSSDTGGTGSWTATGE